MTILIDSDTRVAIYGMAGQYGAAQARAMKAAGTRIVAGVSVGAGGSTLEEVPLFDTMAEAVASTGANAAIVYVPPPGTLDAVVACADTGLKVIMAATEFVPMQDTMRATAYARQKGSWIVGPNTIGFISPGKTMLGSFPANFTMPGPVGIITRSGTLCINAAKLLSDRGIGQSTCIHGGGDYICGRNPLEYFELFEKDPQTKVIGYCGEIGGTKEYNFIENVGKIKKPVVAMVVGKAAPREKRLGHAGALVKSDRDTAQAKTAALKEAGVITANSFPEFITTIVRLAS